jgi:hypothetical protein
MECFFNLIGGLGGIMVFFVPSLVGETNLPPVQLLVSTVLLVFGIAFTYLYSTAQGFRSPLPAK